MASTNKTTNYQLSQYIGTDKPTYLGDYNGDMQKIDTQMKANADSASSANSLATTAKSTADLAEEHAQTGITNAGTADTKATNAQNTATNALTKATKNESDIAKFNLTTFDRVGFGDMSIDTGTLTQGAITIASNSDGSIAKIYGRIKLTNDGQINVTNKVVIPSTLRPATDITINSLGIVVVSTSDGLNAIDTQDIIIRQNGNIEIPVGINQYITTVIIVIHPCLLFIKDFGDVAN